jgi:hypothetical protein
MAALLLLSACDRALSSVTSDQDLGSTDLPALRFDLGGDPPDLAVPSTTLEAQSSTTTKDLLGVWGSSATDMYAVGRGGTVLHSTGDGTWHAQTSGTTHDLYAVWGSSASDIYVVGDEGVFHSTGDGAWHAQTTPSTGYLTIWGSSATDIYIAGFGISHSTGDGAWTHVTNASPPGAIFGMSGRSATDVWAIGGNANGLGAGSGGYERLDANWTWTAVSSLQNLKGVAFVGTAAYVVGNGGSIYDNRNGSWVKETSPTPSDLNGICSADDMLFAVGGSGAFLVSSGDGTWQVEATPSALPLNAVWASSKHDVYAVGANGVILHRS